MTPSLDELPAVQTVPSPSCKPFSEALEAMQSAGVESILMRDRLEEIDHLRELDLLVREQDILLAVEVLQNLGWEPMHKGLIAPMKRTLGLLIDGRLLAIDLHYALVHDGLIYGDAAWFADAAFSTEIAAKQPQPEAQFYHVVMHIILGKASLGDKHCTLINEISACNPDHALMLEQAERFGLRSVFMEVLEDPIQTLSNPATVKRLKRRAVRCLILANPRTLIYFLRSRCAVRIGPLVGIRKGFCIALIGPDGAGKSTFIAEFREQIKTAGLVTREVYMGPWDRSIMPTSKALNWLGCSPVDHIPGTEPSNPLYLRLTKRTKGLIKRYLYYANAPIEFWGRYLLRVLPHILLGRVVLMDRYIYDLELGYNNQILDNGRWLRRLAVMLAPRPQLCLLLSNDPKTIWQRKKEDKLDDIIQAMDTYRQIARQRRIIELHTGVSVQKLVRQVITDHWRHFLRWRSDDLKFRRRPIFRD